MAEHAPAELSLLIVNKIRRNDRATIQQAMYKTKGMRHTKDKEPGKPDA